jgi:oligopeptidase B
MFSPPIAKRRKKILKIGKNNIIDYYDWLRNKDSNSVLDYLDEENNYTKKVIKKTGMINDKNFLYNKMKNMMVESYDTVKLPKGKDGWHSSYTFFERYQKSKKYPHYMYEINGKEKLYLNPNNYQKPNTTLLNTEPIFNESLTIVGIGYNYDGDELYDVKLYKFPEMIELDHKLPEILYGNFDIIGTNIYYCSHNKHNVLTKVIKYDLITHNEEILCSIDGNSGRDVYFYVNDDYKYLIYGWSNYEENELNILPLSEGYNISNSQLILKGKKGVTYTAKIIGNYIIILGNLGKCINNCLFYRKINEKKWNELVQYDENCFMEEIYIIKEGLLVIGRINGTQFMRYIELENYNTSNNSDFIIDDLNVKEDFGEIFGNDGYYLSLYYYDSNSKDIAFSIEDMRTPTTIFKTRLGKGHQSKTRKILWRKQINNYKKNDYDVKRIWINSEGLYLPVDILSCKNSKKETTKKKILLYSYSSYGVNTDNTFDLTRFPLVDEGFEFALLNVRGSSYLGKSFYKDGKLLKRMNTFKDVNNIAEYFHNLGYNVNLEGRSAGGLLSSASSLLKPELYTSVIAIVPFVDVLLSMSDPKIPLTLGEWSEVGNTNISHIYDYVKDYSPVHIVEENKVYPNYYIEGGYNDPRVGYWQPAKLAAILRHSMNKLDHNKLILLKINMDEGHFNAYERYKQIESISEKYSFLIKTNE